MSTESREIKSAGLADWFNPMDKDHVTSFIAYLKDGEDWPNNGTKPHDIDMNYNWENRCISLMALAWINQMIGSE